MTARRNLLPVAVVCAVLLAGTSGVAVAPSPSPGRAILEGREMMSEELTYTVKWKLVTAGSATLRLVPLRDRALPPGFRIESYARSNEFIDAFFKVRDRVTSLAGLDFTRSFYFSKSQQEGTFTREEAIEFEAGEKVALLYRNDALRNTLPLPDEYCDPLSGLYRFRLLASRPGGERVNMSTTDGRRIMTVRTEERGREAITVPAGTFPCVKTEIFMDSLEGIFMRKKHGRIFIWLTDDDSRLPVKMATEVMIGAVETSLVKAEYRPVSP
jgi:hypothetical protein